MLGGQGLLARGQRMENDLGTTILFGALVSKVSGT